MRKRILIESIIFAVLLMSLIIGWQVLQIFQNSHRLLSESPSAQLHTELSVDAIPISQANSNFHIAYWSSPSILLGVDQPFGLDDLLEIVGVLLIFAAVYYIIRFSVHRRKTARK
ncbi:hypothetical protein [Paenibacillus endoradicis]|uniref:hypothetical protein n=1 Tax=Paenibacillus endoradicis TaxID=2972487 RepID=UPI0021592A7E|nr:hypothetical protein [Paenibacillus endoradicis]MCR8656624.1 hypothetical protein [Paenibacillus endoradicis]